MNYFDVYNMLMVNLLVMLTGSFGSILSRCWRMERKGISCRGGSGQQYVGSAMDETLQIFTVHHIKD